MNELKAEKPEEMKRWSKSISTPGGLTKRLEVEEIDNGYIICIEKYGDIDGKYVSKSKKVFSETNPFEEKPKSTEEKNIESMKSLVSDSIFDTF